MISVKWTGLLIVCAYPLDCLVAATRTVALENGAAQGVPAAHFNEFPHPPVLNDRGEAAFIAVASGTTGIWSEAGENGLDLVTRSGTPAPDTPNLQFTNFRGIVLNNPGQTLIEGVVSTGAVGLWLANPNGITELVAIERTRPPGVPAGVTLDQFLGVSFGTVSPSPPVLNDRGQTTFRGLIAGPGIDNITNNDKGLWFTNASGTLVPIAISRDTMTGSANGIDFVGFGQPTMNNHSIVAFGGFLGSAHGPYLMEPNGQLTNVTSTAAGFNNLITPPHINDDGDVAFWAVGTGGMGIWTKPSGGALAPVIQGSAQAPGTAAGVTFDHYFGPALNGEGNVAFAALVEGTGVTSANNKGIWVQQETGLTLVARTGDPAPGVPGALFTELSDVVTFNGQGQVAFTGRAADKTGIWATDQAGVLKIVVAGDSAIDVDSGPSVDLRTVSSTAMFANHSFNGGIGNQDGFASAFNELGQLAFSAVFTDGSSGIFVSNAVAVPEGSFLWQFSVLLLLSCRRLQRATVKC